ncbi:MAG TPA: DUF2339 domain-containing protein, partial [Candidatus Kapabacteria bacterium]|nr:DUF2339 domain-containing protein [Candidatus Kapabacteria bacterium]
MTVLLFLITLLVVAYLAGLIRTLRQRVDVLETQLQWALHNFRAEQEKSVPQQTAKTTNIALQPTLWEAEVFPAESASVQPTPIQQTPEPVAAPPVLPAFDTARPQQQAVPPPFHNRLQEKGRADAQVEPSPAPMATDFNWEQFLGAKMLAWLGGLALFVGIAFFVKYSFERNLVPPWVRVMAGFAIGAGLVGAGVKIRKKDYLITAQTLVATGVVILYAVSFIARSLYHLINTPMLFAVMSGITVAAFSLAIRMDARVVAVLGMLGGFLTPLFVGFSREQPLPLLGYVLVLNAGLLITAKRKNWSFVVPLAAIATLLTEILWIATRLTAGNLIITLVMMAVITVLFVANAKYNPDGEGEPRSLAAGTLQCFALLATFWFMLTNSHGMPSPAILLPTLFFANAALMTLYALTLNVVPLICGVSACGALLAMWIGKSGSVVSACIAALIYAALNALLPAWIAKWRETSKFWPNVASVSGIGLLLLVLFGNSNPGWIFWTILLVLNAVLLAVALVRRNLVLAACGTILTAVLSAYWIIRMDSSASLVQPLLIIGAFALLYFFAARPLSAENESDPNAVYFPALPAGIPFLLLALLMVRIDMDSPSMLFAFALGLNALLIFATPATARVFQLVALIGTLLLQALWFTGELRISNAGVSLAWFVVFSLFFTAFPLLMKRGDRFDLLPWSVSAVAGPVHFGLIYATARMIWPQMTLPGLIPAVLGLPAAAMFVRSRVIAANADEKRQFTGIY